MRLSRIILLVVALLAGGLAAYLATQQIAPPQDVAQQAPQAIEEKKTQVLIAKTSIGVGQRLTEETLEWQDWPESAVRPEYVTQQTMPDATTKMGDAVARFEFFPGEPILETKLVHSGQGYLSAVLAKGMRGVSVQVSANAAAGGFVFPNDRVDVVLTRSANGAAVSETILSNVKVLAIGRRLGETGTTGKPSDPEDPSADIFQDAAIATLELDPAQGETIINATKLGSLSLVLRSIADFGSTPISDVAAVPASADVTASRAIRMIRAGKISDVQTDRFASTADDQQASTETAPATPATKTSVGQPKISPTGTTLEKVE